MWTIAIGNICINVLNLEIVDELIKQWHYFLTYSKTAFSYTFISIDQRIHLMDISMICLNFTSSTDITICPQEKEISSKILHGFPLEPVILLKDEFDARKIHGIIRRLFVSLIGGKISIWKNYSSMVKSSKITHFDAPTLERWKEVQKHRLGSLPQYVITLHLLPFKEKAAQKHQDVTGFLWYGLFC